MPDAKVEIVVTAKDNASNVIKQIKNETQNIGAGMKQGLQGVEQAGAQAAGGLAKVAQATTGLNTGASQTRGILGQLGQAAGTVFSSFSGAASSITSLSSSLGGAATAIGAAAVGLAALARAAYESAVTWDRAARTAKAMGDDVGSVIPRLQEMASTMAKTKDFSKGEIVNVYNQLRVATGNADTSLKNLGMTLDLMASGKFRGARQAANAMAKELQGDSSALEQAIPALKQYLDEQEKIAKKNGEIYDSTKRAADAATYLQNNMKGMGDILDPSVKAVKEFEESWNQVVKTLGGPVLTALTTVLNTVNTLATSVKTLAMALGGMSFSSIQEELGGTGPDRPIYQPSAKQIIDLQNRARQSRGEAPMSDNEVQRFLTQHGISREGLPAKWGGFEKKKTAGGGGGIWSDEEGAGEAMSAASETWREREIDYREKHGGKDAPAAAERKYWEGVLKEAQAGGAADKSLYDIKEKILDARRSGGGGGGDTSDALAQMKYAQERANVTRESQGQEISALQKINDLHAQKNLLIKEAHSGQMETADAQRQILDLDKQINALRPQTAKESQQASLAAIGEKALKGEYNDNQKINDLMNVRNNLLKQHGDHRKEIAALDTQILGIQSRMVEKENQEADAARKQKEEQKKAVDEAVSQAVEQTKSAYEGIVSSQSEMLENDRKHSAELAKQNDLMKKQVDAQAAEAKIYEQLQKVTNPAAREALTGQLRNIYSDNSEAGQKRREEASRNYDNSINLYIATTDLDSEQASIYKTMQDQQKVELGLVADENELADIMREKNDLARELKERYHATYEQAGAIASMDQKSRDHLAEMVQLNDAITEAQQDLNADRALGLDTMQDQERVLSAIEEKLKAQAQSGSYDVGLLAAFKKQKAALEAADAAKDAAEKAKEDMRAAAEEIQGNLAGAIETGIHEGARAGLKHFLDLIKSNIEKEMAQSIAAGMMKGNMGAGSIWRAATQGEQSPEHQSALDVAISKGWIQPGETTASASTPATQGAGLMATMFGAGRAASMNATQAVTALISGKHAQQAAAAAGDKLMIQAKEVYINSDKLMGGGGTSSTAVGLQDAFTSGWKSMVEKGGFPKGALASLATPSSITQGADAIQAAASVAGGDMSGAASTTAAHGPGGILGLLGKNPLAALGKASPYIMGATMLMGLFKKGAGAPTSGVAALPQFSGIQNLTGGLDVLRGSDVFARAAMSSRNINHALTNRMAEIRMGDSVKVEVAVKKGSTFDADIQTSVVSGGQKSAAGGVPNRTGHTF